MNTQHKIETQITSDLLRNHRLLFLADFCLTRCRIVKSARHYSLPPSQPNPASSLSPEEKQCMSGCVLKVREAFLSLVRLDSKNAFSFEQKHSVEAI